MSDVVAALKSRVEHLERQRDDLQRCNNEYLEKNRALQEEVRAIIQHIPETFIVHVMEGGGPEEEIATLAVSISKMEMALTEYDRATSYVLENVPKYQGILDHLRHARKIAGVGT